MRLLLAPLLFLVMVACDSDEETALGSTRLIRVEGASSSASVRVELATTARAREQGLMFRQSLADDRGMLFLFPDDQTGGFWMRNTYVPLTIAYLDAEGRVLEFAQGKPLDTTVLTPSRPYRYVLEVNQGWFERRGLAAGARVVLPPDLPRAQ